MSFAAPDAIDGGRLLSDLRHLATFGATPTGGVSRVAYGSDDLAARLWIEERMRALGMSVVRDAAGNTIGRLAGTVEGLPAIAMGSHTDSVPDGGHYDGALGVIAGLAAVEALQRGGSRLRHPVEVINFAAEEGALAGGTFGSRAMAGVSVQASLDDRSFDGTPVRDHLRRAGMDPGRIQEAAREGNGLKAFMELHIEQSRRLEEAGADIGIVTAIAGIRRYAIVLAGQPDHAGTAAMVYRRDALVAAAEFVIAVRNLALELGIVATVGTLRIRGAAPNVVPGAVDLSLECRAQGDDLLEAFETRIQAFHTQSASFGISRLTAKPPVPSDAALLRHLEAICARHGYPALPLPSGAGHDAGWMSRLCPEVMIFVPSRGGLSHCPEEHTEARHCVIGAAILLDMILGLDEEVSR